MTKNTLFVAKSLVKCSEESPRIGQKEVGKMKSRIKMEYATWKRRWLQPNTARVLRILLNLSMFLLVLSKESAAGISTMEESGKSELEIIKMRRLVRRRTIHFTGMVEGSCYYCNRHSWERKSDRAWAFSDTQGTVLDGKHIQYGVGVSPAYFSWTWTGEGNKYPRRKFEVCSYYVDIPNTNNMRFTTGQFCMKASNLSSWNKVGDGGDVDHTSKRLGGVNHECWRISEGACVFIDGK